MKIRIIQEGNFAGWVRTLLVFAGVLVMVFAYKCVPPAPFGGFLFLFGFVVAAIGGFSSRASQLNIRPFGNNWRKVRKTYEKERNDT